MDLPPSKPDDASAEDEEALAAREVVRLRAALKSAEASARALAAQAHTLEVLVRDSPIAIAVMRGPDLVFERANPSWHALVSGRELLGRRYAEVYPEVVPTPAYASLLETFHTGRAYTARGMKLRIKSQAGVFEDQYFDFSNVQLLNDDGTPYGIACHAVKVTADAVSRLQLQTAEQQVSDVLESMNDAFLSIDKDWRITRVNALHVKATQKSREEQLGQSLLELFFSMPEASASKYWLNYHRAMRERVPVYFEDHYPPLDLWTGVNVYPQADGGLAIFYRYITEQKRKEEILQKAIEARDTFLGIASHELKTPLTTLSLQGQINQRIFKKQGVAAFDEARVQKLIETSLVQTERLARLVDDMLDVSRIASGKLTMNTAETDLTALVAETLARFAPQLEAAGCALTARLAPHTRAHVDAFRFEQVVTNLITNALKYAPGQPVEVALQREGDHAVMALRDHGPGIPAGQLGRIFERFERLVPAGGISGLGLGLHISKEIVEAHGGAIEARSAPGEGAVFTVRVPLRPPAR